MAKFLNTTGVSYHLEELIKNTKDRLILISPYLQFHHRIKDHINNLNIQKKDIRIIYRENKLQVDESKWLEDQIGVRTSICKTLHAKCYINEKEAIVSSMNLYAFSQSHNDEMGILVTKADDPQLYSDIAEEAQRLLTISDELRVSIKMVEKKPEENKVVKKPILQKAKDYSKSKYLNTKELAKETGLTSRNINAWLTKNDFMFKGGDDWELTKKGKLSGGIEKNGQYGQFIIWPEEIISIIKA